MVLHLLQAMREDMRDMRSELKDLRSEMATKSDLAEVKAELQSEIKSLRADVASDFLTHEKRMNDQFTTLRRAVMEYHSTAVGHGMLYTELEERVRKIEQRLDMTPAESH
jgi:phage shock protein A